MTSKTNILPPMNDVLVLDTHPLAWYIAPSPALPQRTRMFITEALRGQYTVLVPTVVLAEMVGTLAKLHIPLNVTDVLDQLLAAGVRLVPFDETILRRFLTLPTSLDIHDRIIVATALEHGGAVVTKDARIIASGAVGTVW